MNLQPGEWSSGQYTLPKVLGLSPFEDRPFPRCVLHAFFTLLNEAKRSFLMNPQPGRALGAGLLGPRQAASMVG